MPRTYYHFYRIDDRDDELSRSSNGIIESNSAMTLYCTENLHSCGARTRAVNTAVSPANHLAITAVIHSHQIMLLKAIKLCQLK